MLEVATTTKPDSKAATHSAVKVKTPRTVLAHLRFLRMSPRKVRLVAATVKHMPATAAVDYLKLMPQAGALPLSKLIASAVANANHNFQIASEDLVVQQILVNQGPTLKRFRPRAFGRAGEIRKRSSHISVTLVERAGAGRKISARPKSAAPPSPDLKTVTMAELKRTVSEGEQRKGQSSEAHGPAGKGFTRKLFQRKAG